MSWTIEGRRDSRVWPSLVDFWQDVRYGARTLRRDRTLSIVAILTLALGLGANTAIFSVVYHVLLSPLPYREPDRLVAIWENDRIRGTERERFSAPDFADLRTQSKSFDDLSVYQPMNLTLTGAGDPQRLRAGRVSTGFFRLFGVETILGRDFRVEEEQPGKERVVVLGEGMWRRQFGADRSILGRATVLDGDSYTVIGVISDRINAAWRPFDVWIPVSLFPSEMFRGRHNFRVFGRVRRDATVAEANTEVSGIMKRLEQAYPDDNKGRGGFAVPVKEEFVGGVQRALLILFGATATVLLIACVNVASLLLGRASARRRELAIRVSLGAGRGRLVRQLFAETLLLAVCGCAAGIALAYAGVRFLVTLGPATLPRLGDAHIDSVALGFAAGSSALTWLVFGILPGVRASQTDAGGALSDSGRGATDAPGRQRTRRALVTAQIALSVVLVTGAGLLLRSLMRLSSVDPGFDPSNVLMLSLELPPARYQPPRRWPILEWPQVVRLQDQLTERVRSLPGVKAAAVSIANAVDAAWTTRVTVAGRPAPPPGEQDEALFRPVSEDYFAALRISMLRGRPFNAADDARHPLVAIIDEAFVRRHFPAKIRSAGESTSMAPSARS